MSPAARVHPYRTGQDAQPECQQTLADGQRGGQIDAVKVPAQLARVGAMVAETALACLSWDP